MINLINKFKNLPVAMSGLALGASGLGNLLASEVHPNLRYIFVGIAILILIMISIKKLAHFQLLKNEIANPVAGSFVPAFDMALMVVASIIAEEYLLIGQVLWYFAIILHIIFATSFFYYQIKTFEFNQVLPSWYIPPVGIVVACVTSIPMNNQQLAQIIFYIGFSFYCFMLPIMMYRLIFGERINNTQLPAFAVMSAPASLCLAGYLTVFEQPSPLIVGILLPLGLMMTGLVYLSMVRINPLRIGFIPLYASFTFPLAIGATAIIKYSHFIGEFTTAGRIWHNIGIAEMIIACIIIFWVLINMTHFVYKNVLNSSTIT
ncbi:TDT family transporter [Candidatus Trichorickettsia mobilis]|uniref:TDT family transporter n=1 Tax=Candidatus Trichorickettsia mobilis TaxID=1346319 RepID=A0ABZ0UU99_9RICK|nr:TDT family transporter [Candidatus Trichorickettsia mobilis]WPY00672.1 TDT family transporter [Candidatus Trichorickettsia mobilis]